MKTILKSLAIGLSLIAGVQAMECAMDVENEWHSSGCIPQEIIPMILEYISTDRILDLKTNVSFNEVFGNWRLVCKSWQTTLDTQINAGKGESWNEKKKLFFKNSL